MIYEDNIIKNLSNFSLDILLKCGKTTVTLPKNVFVRLPDWCKLTSDITVNLVLSEFNPQTMKDVFISISSKAEFRANCQRCLGQMVDIVEFSIKGKASADEPKNFIFLNEDIFENENDYSKQGELNLIRICEDELLLALPMVPKHKVENCSLKHHRITDENNITNPFSLLLKGEDKN